MEGIAVLAIGVLAIWLVGAAVRARRRRAIERRAAGLERAVLGERTAAAPFDPAAVVVAARRHLAALPHRGGRDDLAAVEERFGRHSLVAIRELAAVWDERRPHPFCFTVAKASFHVVEVERDARGGVSGAAVRVEAVVHAWTSRLGYRAARVVNALLGAPGASALSQRLVAYWLFEPHARGWALARLEPGPAGEHRLRGDATGEAQMIQRLRRESVHELVDAPASPEIPFEIASNLPPRADDALRELALVDDRFAWPVIEAVVREAVERWERAAGGDPGVLREVADPRVVRTLLAGDRVLRGARLRSVRPVRVWALRVPPEVDVELVVIAWRGRSGSVLGEAFPRSHWWRLAASDSREVPWTLVEASDEPLPRRTGRRRRAPRHVHGRRRRGTP